MSDKPTSFLQSAYDKSAPWLKPAVTLGALVAPVIALGFMHPEKAPRDISKNLSGCSEDCQVSLQVLNIAKMVTGPKGP